MMLDDITVNRSDFHADMKNMIVRGASGFKVEKINVELDNPLIDIQVTIPKVIAQGYYENIFNLGWLNARAKGRITSRVTNLKMRLTFKGHLEEHDDRIYIKFDDFEVNVKMRKIGIQLENAFSDFAINRAVNNFINKNTGLFLPEIESVIRKTLG